MDFRNSTALDSTRLERMFLAAAEGWPHERLRVAVRYSRGAEYSGTCYYRDARIYINLGRHNSYPRKIMTHVAPARSRPDGWSREAFSVEVSDPYELVQFVFVHELYHWLIRCAGRNMRQKEGRCDRFAVRWLVDRFGRVVRDARGRIVDRSEWDFQDLDGFVSAARRGRRGHRPVSSPGQMRLFGG